MPDTMLLVTDVDVLCRVAEIIVRRDRTVSLVTDDGQHVAMDEDGSDTFLAAGPHSQLELFAKLMGLPEYAVTPVENGRKLGRFDIGATAAHLIGLRNNRKYEAQDPEEKESRWVVA